MSAQKASIRMSEEEAKADLPEPELDEERVKAEEKAKTLADKTARRVAEQVEMGNQSHIDIEIDNGPMQGTIRMFRPSLDQERQIGIRVAKYLQGAVGTDVKTENLAIFFSTFDVVVDWDSAPDWFKPREMFDYGLLNYVYGRFADWLRSFRGFVPPESQADSETAGESSQVVDSKRV